MFVDEYGYEDKTEKEIEDFARKDFYNKDNSDLAETFAWYISTTDLLKWIFENDKENFIKDYKDLFKLAEDDYVSDYFIIHDIEEM